MGQTVLKGGMNVPTCTSHGQSTVVSLQLTSTFLWNYKLQCIMRKAFSVVIPFSSLQAWPEGRLEPTYQGMQSLLAPKPCSALMSFQRLQGSRTAARL